MVEDEDPEETATLLLNLVSLPGYGLEILECVPLTLRTPKLPRRAAALWTRSKNDITPDQYTGISTGAGPSAIAALRARGIAALDRNRTGCRAGRGRR